METGKKPDALVWISEKTAGQKHHHKYDKEARKLTIVAFPLFQNVFIFETCTKYFKNILKFLK